MLLCTNKYAEKYFVKIRKKSCECLEKLECYDYCVIIICFVTVKVNLIVQVHFVLLIRQPATKPIPPPSLGPKRLEGNTGVVMDKFQNPCILPGPTHQNGSKNS